VDLVQLCKKQLRFFVDFALFFSVFFWNIGTFSVFLIWFTFFS